ncbi:trypsin delta-like [Spodoptera litura]|uniref:trypsin n=1 Tax=Spodoptera litura TaxID=69820 RepID=A0A9J7E6A4_SPOLT|nr:trypsin delta-like [Spodoptera litura]
MQLSVEIILILVSLSCVITIPVPDNTDLARIVNGEAVDITEVPYQAALRRRVLSGWAHSCGAVIITNRGLLTAAHCVEAFVSQPSLLRVVVGTSSRLNGGKTYDVSAIYSHEAFSATTLENDIALLATSKVIEFSESVAPVSFASEHYVLPAGTGAVVSGFGTTSYEGSSSEVLKAARVSIVSQSVCARAYLRIATIGAGMVCANGSNPPKDACQGDSGGPLVVRNVLVGIVSWGEGCANTNYPGVYTRVSEYSPWIRQKLEILRTTG